LTVGRPYRHAVIDLRLSRLKREIDFFRLKIGEVHFDIGLFSNDAEVVVQHCLAVGSPRAHHAHLRRKNHHIPRLEVEDPDAADAAVEGGDASAIG